MRAPTFLTLFCVVLFLGLFDGAQAKTKAAIPLATQRPGDAYEEFCARFVRACYDLGVTSKKVGLSKIVHACRRNGGIWANSYDFGCTVNGQKRTQEVLNKIGMQGLGTSTVKKSSTKTVTTQKTSTATKAVTTTKTFTAPTPAANGTTTIVTTLPISELPNAVIDVVIPQSAVNKVVQVKGAAVKRKNDVDNNGFCKGFTAACSGQCGRFKSTIKDTVCRAGSNDKWSMSCVCKNGKILTQHTLASLGLGVDDIVTKKITKSVMTIKSGTKTITLTSTFKATTTPPAPLVSKTITILTPTGVIQAVNSDPQQNNAIAGYVVSHDTLPRESRRDALTSNLH